MSINDTYQWYELTPFDAWFFRDGRPMNRGEDARGVKSLFPPSAETVVGAFRAALARGHGWSGRGDWTPEIKKVLGDGFDDLGGLSFLGPLLSRKGEALFACPRHVLFQKDESGKHAAEWLRLSEPVVCDLGTAVRLPVPPPRTADSPGLAESDGHYLTTSGLKKVLQGELPATSEVFRANDLYSFETRVGILRDEQTRTVGEASLYNPTFVRLRKDVSLLVGLSGLPKGWEVPSLFPMGGESRMAKCGLIATDPSKMLSGSGNGSLLLALTPVLSQTQEWHGPGPGGDISTLDASLGGTVESVVSDRPLLVPSWDSVKRHPRNQLLAIPPGTVWWLTGSNPKTGIQQIGARCQHGYGMVVSAEPPQLRAKG